MNQPQARVRVERIGREGEPVVTIDGFTGDVQRLRRLGIASHYQAAGVDYPGLRALADPSYLGVRRDLMMRVVSEVFGLRRSIQCEIAAFSLVTLAEEALSARQCIPHHDHSDAGRIAIMHYTQGPSSGGTAFYRHRRTGFEAITPEREAAYAAALEQDKDEFGDPPKAYPYGDSERYEMIAQVEAAPDRLILYRGRQLHSGIIPDPSQLDTRKNPSPLTP